MFQGDLGIEIFDLTITTVAYRNNSIFARDKDRPEGIP